MKKASLKTLTVTNVACLLLKLQELDFSQKWNTCQIKNTYLHETHQFSNEFCFLFIYFFDLYICQLQFLLEVNSILFQLS